MTGYFPRDAGPAVAGGVDYLAWRLTKLPVVAIGPEEMLRDLRPRLVHIGFEVVGEAPGLDDTTPLADGVGGEVAIVAPGAPSLDVARWLPRFIEEHEMPVVLLLPGDPLATEVAGVPRGCAILLTPCDDLELASVVQALAEGARARATARREAGRLGAIMRSLPHAVFLCDNERRVLLLNPAAERLSAVPMARAVGTPIGEVLHLMEHTMAERSARGGDALPPRDSIRTAGGGTRIVEVRIATVGLWRSRPGSVVSIQDVTDEVDRLEELAASENKFSRIVELAQDCIISVDADLRIVLFNRAAEHTFGYARHEVIGAQLDTLMPERFRWAHSRYVGEFATAAGETRRARERPLVTGLRKNNEEFLAEVSLSKMTTRSGVMFTAFLRDMTAEHRAEAALRATEGRFQAVFESSGLGVILLDADGMVLEESPAANRIMRRAHPPKLGRSFLTDISIDHQKTEQMLFRELMSGHRDQYRLESQVLAEAEEAVWIKATVSKMEPRRERIAAVRILEDLTEQKSLEEQLLHAQKMEALGRIAGGVAHDFNNVLTVVVGYAEMLMEMIAPDDERFDMAAEICEAAKRASSLSDQLLVFGRKSPLHLELTAIDDLVAGTMRMLKRVVPASIAVQTSFNAEDVWISVDRGYLEQVVINLVRNSCDAMAGGGEVTVHTEARTVQEGERPDVEEGNFVALTVRDTGVGMDEATRRKVFEPFFTTKPPGSGTGLGLATVFGFSKKSGGTVEVTSQPGHGTTVTVLLPVADPNRET